MESFQKQPYEAFVIAGDFASVIQTGEAINEANSTVIAADKTTGDDMTIEVIMPGSKTVDGTQLKAQVKGGVSGVTYKVTFRIETDAIPANKWEIDVLMKVKEL